MCAWQELTRLVIESKKQGDPLASIVHALDLANHAVDVVLSEEDDDADEEALTAPATLVRLDVRLSAFANARTYYTEKKAAAVKTEKTLQAAQAAVKAAEIKAAKSVQALKVNASIRAIRQTFWFEKFDWFVSTDNCLVVSARDGQQAEMLVRRHLKPGDRYVHADVAGAPVTVIKALPGTNGPAEISPATLALAGTCVICRSDGWQSKLVTSAWWALEDQVSKLDDTGMYLPTGSFNVRGYRHCTRIRPPRRPRTRHWPAHRLHASQASMPTCLLAGNATTCRQTNCSWASVCSFVSRGAAWPPT